MTPAQSEQVAALLNSRNQLTRRYAAEDVFAAMSEYELLLADSGDVQGFVQIKRVQWYQAEVCHLAVFEQCEGKGLGRHLLEMAESHASRTGCRVLQCTIRLDNHRSLRLFEKARYQIVGAFHNGKSGNDLAILQKVLIPAEGDMQASEADLLAN